LTTEAAHRLAWPRSPSLGFSSPSKSNRGALPRPPRPWRARMLASSMGNQRSPVVRRRQGTTTERRGNPWDGESSRPLSRLWPRDHWNARMGSTPPGTAGSRRPSSARDRCPCGRPGSSTVRVRPVRSEEWQLLWRVDQAHSQPKKEHRLPDPLDALVDVELQQRARRVPVEAGIHGAARGHLPVALSHRGAPSGPRCRAGLSSSVDARRAWPLEGVPWRRRVPGGGRSRTHRHRRSGRRR